MGCHRSRYPRCHALRILTVSLGLLLPWLASETSLATCIDYNQYLHWVSGVATTTEAYGIAWGAGYAYISSDTAFEVIDVSNPQVPRVVGSVPLGSSGGDIALVDHYAYLANWTDGLKVIDVEDPQHPAIVGGSASLGSATGLVAKGDHLYLTTVNQGAPSNSQLQIFSIAEDPTTPRLTGMVTLPNYGWDVAVAGSYAYVADDMAGIITIDISDPTDPGYVGRRDTPGFAHGVSVSGDILYVADFSSLQVATIGNPASPQLIGAVGMSSFAFSATAYGSYVCVGDYEAGLQVVDAADPSHPHIVGWVDTRGLSFNVAIDGRTAYVADGTSLQVIMLSDTPIDVTGTWVTTPSYANHTVLKDGYAYVADYSSGIQVVDVAATPPRIVAAVDTPSFALSDAVTADKLIVADEYGVCLIDISQPTHPVLLGSGATPGTTYDVAVADETAPAHYAFVAAGRAGLVVIDASGSTPVVVGSVATPDETRWVSVSGNWVFMADETAGLIIIDASDPTHPEVAGTVPIANAGGMAVSGNRAYVADPHGFTIVDVSDVHDPAVLGYATLRLGQTPCMAADRDNVYISQLDNDVLVVDVTDPANARVVGEMHLYPGYAQAMTVKDCTLYISAITDGLVIAPAQAVPMAVESPDLGGAHIRMSAFPNPATDRAAASFELPSATWARVQVIDAAGRCVRRLVEGEMAAGRHVVEWNCRDEAGRRVPSGTFFVRIESGCGSAANRLILLR